MRPRIVPIVLFIALAALICPQALAADAVPGAQAPDLFTAGAKMFGALAMLIGGLLFTLYLVRRAAAGRGGLLGGQEMIRVISTKALAPKKYIALVEIGDSVLTLGVTNEGITRLDKNDAASFRNALPQQPATENNGGFASRLKALTGVSRSSSQEERA